jgi:hypothetical protein
VERKANGQCDPEREGEPERGHAEQPPAETVEVDLEPGEQEQEGETEQGQRPHRRVHLRPAEHGRADEDPADELEHHGGKRRPRQQSQQERRQERDGRDDEHAHERHAHFAPSCSMSERY